MGDKGKKEGKAGGWKVPADSSQAFARAKGRKGVKKA